MTNQQLSAFFGTCEVIERECPELTTREVAEAAQAVLLAWLDTKKEMA